MTTKSVQLASGKSVFVNPDNVTSIEPASEAVANSRLTQDDRCVVYLADGRQLLVVGTMAEVNAALTA